ncbi:AraC family transcriptional regulator [Flavobacteriales bacterium 34_180_T64]|nr:AraC family transcriptional regulator [Flavobacteriales bacterium 34_180_T64]
MTPKASNRVIYLQNLNKVIDYIHTHLEEKIDIKTLADISCFSPFHFHRITRALLNEPIGAYIARSRVETAAKMLGYSSDNIEKIAYSVGFETPSSLSKAFKQHFGISPSNYRKNKKITIKNPDTMKTKLQIKKPKIATIEDKQCIYYRMHGAYQTLDYANAWGALWEEVKRQKLFTAGIESIGQSHDDPNVTDEKKIRYDACLVIHIDAKPNGDVGTKTLKGGRFAIFQYQGSYTNFPEVYDYIFNEWLMDNDYELRDESVRERYRNDPRRTEEAKLKTDIYLPIK